MNVERATRVLGMSAIALGALAVVAGSPEIVVVAPCGYGLSQSIDAARAIEPPSGTRVIAVDANAYFARPGPRVAEGIELLAHLFHPSRFDWAHDHQPWEQVVRF